MERTLEELKELYRSLTPKDGTPCAYCGVYATDDEHVTPDRFEPESCHCLQQFEDELFDMRYEYKFEGYPLWNEYMLTGNATVRKAWRDTSVEK